MSVSIKEGEELLPLHCNQYQIIQRKEGFRFGLDAVLLADFCKALKNDRVCDLGTGSGIMPLLLAANTPCLSITGVEIQSDYADMAARSVALNDLSDRISIIEGDYRTPLLRAGSFSLVIANPPYQKVGSGLSSPSSDRALACMEHNATLPEVIGAASLLLREGGRFCMVYRPERLCEAIGLLSAHALPVKKLRFALRNAESEPSLVLIECRKGSAEGVRVLPPLILCGDTPSGESPELLSIYRRTQEFDRRQTDEN